ncbi:uncharacterized protein [Typha angustifolia]|uniref:uncharacterized protein isoform X2 n=1 Tax=Typha angustifolia TaxID=59011 RepID=UPI003C2F1D73
MGAGRHSAGVWGKKVGIVVAVGIAVGSWFYSAIKPPPPKICGSDGGPPVTATRIRLKDGRFLAYLESGVPKENARFKIVFSHGFGGSRSDILRAAPNKSESNSNDSKHFFLRVTQTLELIEELGVYMVGFDRAGYGESDPNPKRSLRSAVSDVEELADALELGPKFYLVGFSLGCHAVWASIKYIPERLAGVALVAPVVNHRWAGFPKDLAKEVYKEQQVGDQWSLRVSYYAPWLLHWWMKQTWLPTSTVIKGTVPLPNELDLQKHIESIENGTSEMKKLATQQGLHESFYRDMKVMFGKWEFDPMDLKPTPFPVHLWQGDEDGLVPVRLQRYICSRLSWINYHELPETGHFLSSVPGFGDGVLRTLLLKSSST